MKKKSLIKKSEMLALTKKIQKCPRCKNILVLYIDGIEYIWNPAEQTYKSSYIYMNVQTLPKGCNRAQCNYCYIDNRNNIRYTI